MLLCLLLCGGQRAVAQLDVPPVNSSSQPGQVPKVNWGNQDSIKKAERKVPQFIIGVDPEAIRYGLPYADTVRQVIDYKHRWDETDTLKGFLQSLGQFGKPYQRFLYGLPDSYLNTPLYTDPLTRRTEVYLFNPNSQVPFFETHTPYVFVDFSQADQKVQVLTVKISENITPFLNVTGYYRRRSGVGAYTGMITDHYNAGFSTYLHTYDRRYVLTASVSWNQLSDQINGGTLYSGEQNYDTLFAKQRSAVNLTQNALVRRVRNLTLQQTYNLLKSAHNEFTLIMRAEVNQHFRRYLDYLFHSGTGPQVNNFKPFRPYGFIYKDSDTLREEYLVDEQTLMGGLRIKGQLFGLSLQNQFELAYKSLRTSFFSSEYTEGQPTSGVKEQITSLRYSGFINLVDTARDSKLNWRADLSRNNIFSSPEITISSNLKWTSRATRFLLKDTLLKDIGSRFRKVSSPFKGLYFPVLFHAGLQLQSRNPSLFDSFWYGATFQGNNKLQNEYIGSLNAALRYTGKPATYQGIPYEQSYVELGAFSSGREYPILYDNNAQPVQDQSGGLLLWSGIQAAFRGRAGRFYLENQTTGQLATKPNNDLLTRYAKTQPSVYGKTSVYYQNRVFREGTTIVRFGLDFYYFSSYLPLSFEPSVQNWYPQVNYHVSGYVKVDAVVSAQLSFAQVFFKFSHLNEGFGTPGYFTTPLYPMLARTFSFGLNWTFYD